MYDDALAWIVSLALLGAIMLLASVALRAGESAGHQAIERPAADGPEGAEPGLRGRLLPLGRLAARLRGRSR